MALILNIDTATESAYVGISRDEVLIAFKENHQQKEHASFLHLAIQALCTESGISLQELDAIAVTSGPGSYTGLRVGMAAAKGLCYALKKPLITISTLKVMTIAALNYPSIASLPSDVLFCPMIDARRMEVFTAIFDKQLNEIVAPAPLILTENSFTEILDKTPVLFFGNGKNKFKEVSPHTKAHYINVDYNVSNLAFLASKSYHKGVFADVAYAEPEYLKAFYSTAK